MISLKIGEKEFSVIRLNEISADVAFEGIEDNKNFSLFFKIDSSEDCIKAISNWKQISKSQKQNSADEFFARYNTNHFADMI